MIENCTWCSLFPRTITELYNPQRFFRTTAIDHSFLDIPIEEWPETQSYNIACEFLNNLTRVNDSSECSVALIQDLNSITAKIRQRTETVFSTCCEKR